MEPVRPSAPGTEQQPDPAPAPEWGRVAYEAYSTAYPGQGVAESVRWVDVEPGTRRVWDTVGEAVMVAYRDQQSSLQTKTVTGQAGTEPAYPTAEYVEEAGDGPQRT